MSDGAEELTPERAAALIEAALKDEMAAGSAALERGEFTDVDDHDLDTFLEGLAIEKSR